MNLSLIYFSPTGGTERIARKLAQAISSQCREMDLSSRSATPPTLSADDIAVIAVPSFSGRMPALAAQRLRAIKANGARAIVVAVYGNRAYEDTLIELADIATEQGFNVVGAVSAVARHSIVTKIASSRPDAEDMKTLDTFGKKIYSKLNSGSTTAPHIPGNRPYRKTGGAFTPKTYRKCNNCGKCVRECPAGAISKENPRNVDKKLCIGCMRCVETCTQKAKHLSPILVFLAGQMLKKPCATRKEPELFL